MVILTGCAQKNDLEQAQEYGKQSGVFYQRAAGLYRDLIAQGKDLDRLYFELGKLYYSHGDFKEAIAEFKKTRESQAEKFLAVSYYRLGDFTGALEVFNKIGHCDNACLYYYGLTCERLNLFDQALKIYPKIKTGEFSSLAAGRIDIIEKQANAAHIEDIDPKAYAILSSAPSAQAYPQAGALILYCDEKTEITPQDTQITQLHYIVKVLNPRGKEAFSESHIDYDATYEKVELEYARTIKPDGTILEVGSRHIRDVSKYLNFPLYSNARVYIISFPEITEDACIEYKLKIYRNQLINRKDFIISYPVQTSEPIIKAKFSLTLPKGKDVHIKTINDRYNNFGAVLNPAVSEANGRLIYSWDFKDIPQIIPEPHMPASVEINPAVLISTFNSWQDVYAWWWMLAEDKIKADAAIKEKVSELTGDKDFDEDRIRAIYNFCAQKIRYVAVEYGQAGYEPHRAEDIFKNKYGDCKDQAILLIAMLREAGFSAYPVLIPTKGCYNLYADFPSLFFNHCIAAVSLKDKLVFLDPTAETCAFGDLPIDDQGRKVLVFKEEGFSIQEIPLYPALHNLVQQRANIKINKDETISGDKAVFSYGMYDQAQRSWLLYTPPELIAEMLREKIQEISIGGQLGKYKIKNSNNLDVPIELSYTFTGPEYLTAAGPLRLMPQLADLEATLVAKKERKYPIDFLTLDIKEKIFEIEYPPNFAVKYLPESIFEDSPWLKMAVEYLRKDKKIYFRQSIELKKDTVPEEEYPSFKAFFEGLAKKAKQRIVLERVR